MEFKVLIDENENTSIKYDETEYDKGTVGAFPTSALNYTKELPAKLSDIFTVIVLKPGRKEELCKHMNKLVVYGRPRLKNKVSMNCVSRKNILSLPSKAFCDYETGLNSCNSSKTRNYKQFIFVQCRYYMPDF